MSTLRPRIGFLDLSGFGFTGKHAVIDLVREFRGYHVPHYTFEFLLLRIQGGLLDLKTALWDDWSPVRSHAAVRQFLRLVDRVGGRSRYWNPFSWFNAIGTDYEIVYNNQFRSLSRDYIRTLTVETWSAEWPYAVLEWSDLGLFWRRALRKLGLRRACKVQMYLVDPENFLEATRDYLAKLLTSNSPQGTRTVVLHNAFEPFNPYRSLTLFDDARCIVVDRDPRDNYIDSLKYEPLALPVDKFIARYRLYRQIARRNETPSNRVLRIRFEELVLNYDKTVAEILRFLGEDQSVHVDPRRYFDPAISQKNIGLWRRYRAPEEIRAIENELGEFCHRG